MNYKAEHITVSFPGVVALDQVDIEVSPGRIHAVLGANGSGKSTLVKVLTGVYHPDKNKGAKITIGDTEVEDILSPRQAFDMGIRVVHQESPLIDVFTVAECIALFKGYPKKRFGKIDWKKLDQYVKELLEEYEIDLSPKTPTQSLNASQRNMLAMAIAIGKDEEARNSKMLILDEADASIPEAEAEYFLNHVRKIADRGLAIAMVTHRLNEVKKICDDITVLNGGKRVYSGEKGSIDDDKIIELMSPRNEITEEGQVSGAKHYTLDQLWEKTRRAEHQVPEETVLSFRKVSAGSVRNLSFDLRKGEILGFVGIPGSGVEDLPMILNGEIARTDGEYRLCAKTVPNKSKPRTLMDMGLCLLPTDRPKRGGIMNATLRENMLLASEGNYWHQPGRIKDVIEMSEQIFDIHPAGMMQMDFGKFSGGNQQKAILAKWLGLRPAVLVLDDPTYGVDPSSRMKVFDAVRTASDTGIGMIMFSTEPEQMAYICTRVLVLRSGAVVSELKQSDGSLTREEVARWCYA